MKKIQRCIIDALSEPKLVFSGVLAFSIVVLIGCGLFFSETDAQARRTYVGRIATPKRAEDVYGAVKTVIKTIHVLADSAETDFAFDNTAENSTSQNVDLGVIIPAWSEIISCNIRCYESVRTATFDVTLGTASAGNQLLAQATVDSTDEFTATAATAGPVIALTAAAQHVWINGDPGGADWDEINDGDGKWAVMVTYIDYGAVHTLN